MQGVSCPTTYRPWGQIAVHICLVRQIAEHIGFASFGEKLPAQNPSEIQILRHVKTKGASFHN